jgi:hypothetical protein
VDLQSENTAASVRAGRCADTFSSFLAFLFNVRVAVLQITNLVFQSRSHSNRVGNVLPYISVKSPSTRLFQNFRNNLFFTVRDC